MLVIEDLVRLIRKKGFLDTLQVLTSFKGNRVEKHTFYDELNKFSYYNSFFRVKDQLIKRDLIRIENSGKKKYIMLTDKGLAIYNKLVEVNNMIIKGNIKN